MKKRILSLLLALLLVASILPMPTYAEDAPDHGGDVGKYVRLNEEVTNFTVYGVNPASSYVEEQTFWHEDFLTGTIFQITDWMMKDEQLWYAVTFYTGGLNAESSYAAMFPEEPWLRQTEAGELVFLETCASCGKPDCGGHAEVEWPSLTDPDTSVKVTVETLPEGVALQVKPADVSGQLAEFCISEERKVFGLDISMVKDGEDYQTGATVKVPVEAEPGTLVGILHTHENETTYLGLVQVQNDKTIEFETDGFSEFAGFTVDFHYNGVDYSIEGMTSILLSELFAAIGIDEDAAQATAVVFSNNDLVQVSKENNDWRLTSLEAFKTEETLIISFNDGRTIVIDVTDATKIDDHNFNPEKEYTVPDENDDYIVIWIDADQLPATVKLKGSYSFSWAVDTADPNKDYASFSKDGKTATITVNKNAPIGYKYSLRNRNAVFKQGRAIVRVIESVKFRYNKGSIVTSPTTFPSTSGTKKIGTWSIADTSADTTGRTNTFDISTTTPAAPGYTFVNWSYTDWQGTTQQVAAGGTVRLDGSSINMDDRDYVDFTANWTKNSYKITYDEKGGSSVDDQTYNVETNLTLRGAPTREGYTFKGWKLSTKTESWAAGTYSASQNMGQANYGNITLEAQWEIVSNAVVYTYTGTIPANAPTAPAQKSYDYNSSVTVEAAPTLTGYTFSGWSTSDAAVSGGKFTMPNKTVTFSGYWTPNQYQLTFDYNGGKNSETGKTDDVTYTATYGWKDYYGVGGLYPVREGYTFNGWYTDPVAGDQIYGSDNICIPGTQYWNSSSEWIGTANATFYAHWTVNSHNVTYSYMGTVPAGADPVPSGGKVNYGTEVTVAANPAAVAGYTFSGWTVSGASVANGKFSMPDNDVTITGSWTVSECTVTFQDDDGTVLSSASYPHGTKAADIKQPDLSAGKKDAEYNYIFTGWTPEIADVTGNATYTATYEKTPNSYTVTWVFGNGTENKVETLTYGSTITKPSDPARTGYDFQGWSPTVPETMPAADQTFTAQWDRSLVDLTIQAATADEEQNFIFTVSGIRSDGVAFDPIEVVLCAENDFQVTIKDLPVGTYTVTEKDGWSWRENTVNSQTADLKTESSTIFFDFDVVDKRYWLSGYSCKRRKGGG